jgi:hypothetical protein
MKLVSKKRKELRDTDVASHIMQYKSILDISLMLLPKYKQELAAPKAAV